MRNWLSYLYRFLHLPAFLVLSFVIIGLTYYGGTLLLSFLEDIQLVVISKGSPISKIILMFFEMTGVIVFITIGHALLKTSGFKEIGISLRRQSRYLGLGVILALMMSLPYLLIVYLLGGEININTQFSVKPVFYYFVFYTFAAINEEFLYRGFMEKEFAKLLNPQMVIPVSAIFFAWAHFYNLSFLFEFTALYYFINLVLGGTIFSLCYRYSRNIWFPIIVHLCFNSFRELFGIYDFKHGLLEIEVGKWDVYIDSYGSFFWMILNVLIILLLVRFKSIFLMEQRDNAIQSN